ncbi:MAG: phosphatase PAP2 family protein [Alphaproteobacteria bacterium]
MERAGETIRGRESLTAWIGLTAAAAIAAIFIAFPGLDLFFSGLFHVPGRGFPAESDRIVQTVRYLWRLSAWTVVIGAGALLLASALLGRPRLLGIGRAALVFFLLLQGLGPGLMVNTVLKDNWGRARPSQVVEFGGAKRHDPALLPTDQCGRNCSFVGGEAAYAFSFMALGFLPGPTRRKRAWFAFGAVFGVVVSAVRVAQGGHFVSDCVFAGFLMLLIGWALHALLYRAPLPAGLARWLGVDR